MSKKKQKKIETKKEDKLSFLDKIPAKNGYIFIGVIFFITLLIFYKPLVFDKLEPAGGDRMAATGATHQYVQYSKNTGEPVLWNPNIFCGIPIYFNKNSNSFNLDILATKLNKFFDWRVIWLIIGATGLFLLLNFLKFPWYISATGVIAFLFLPHFQALIIVGHNYKIRAICALPLVIYSFLNYTRKRDLFSLALFTIFFSLLIRTKHYQILFYALLLILTIGIYIIIKMVKSGEANRIFKTVGLFICGIIVAIFMSAQPLFVTKEYTPFSTRTKWSFSIKEMMTLISPRFLGGTSSEIYTGSKFARYKNQRMPTYWGDMPFTQSSEYIGILIVILAVLGIFYFRKDGFVISLSILLLFSLLLSLGKHFPILYKPLFLYLPYFSKFRVPMMIMILVSFIIVILSMYGLKGLLAEMDKKKLKITLYIISFFTLLGLIPLIFPSMLSFSGPADARYANNPQVIEMFKAMRIEMMTLDNLRMLALIAAFTTLIILFYLKKIKRELVIVGIFFLVAIDMISVSYRFFGNARFVNDKNIERNYFRESQFDKIIKQDQSFNRVLGLGSFFQSNNLAYRHNLVAGYSAIKPQLVQDIVDNNLYHSPDPKQPVNWNVINMLNAKYIISPAMLQHEGLQIVAQNKQEKSLLFQNQNALPRALFVENVLKMSDEEAVVRYMNSVDFNPKKMALTTNADIADKSYGIDGSVEITEYTPNRITLKTDNNSTAFLVLSEAYYPIGWTATINSGLTKIYQVNHMLRGIEVPAGQNEIIFEFKPKSYSLASMTSSILTNLVWFYIIVSLVIRYKDRLNINNLAKFKKQKKT